MQKTTVITLIVAVLFVCGAGAIMYYGRPVMNIDESPEETVPAVVEESTPEETKNESEEETSEQEADETDEPQNTAAQTPLPEETA
ncbi:MAG: hypothetical protein AAB448_04090, partial [Patescibacteria group bacterium]